MREWARSRRGLLQSGATAALLAVLLTPVQAQPVKEPAPGVLLVAAERMADPRFNQSVLLLIKHDRTGSWGLIINKPTKIDVAEVLSTVEPEDTSSKVHFGGPVRIEQLTFLYQDDSMPGIGATGLKGVRWSNSEETLTAQLEQNPDAVRVYAGYAGWAPGQLAFELARGGWQMIRARREDVFSDEPGNLWQHLTDVLGGIAI